jgi:hypothetical protein
MLVLWLILSMVKEAKEEKAAKLVAVSEDADSAEADGSEEQK